MPKADNKAQKIDGSMLGQRVEQIAAKQRRASQDLHAGQSGALFEDEGLEGKTAPAKAGVNIQREVTASKDLRVKQPLPVWGENERAGPNVLMRSALFSIAPLNMQRWVAVASKPREISCLGEYEISMVGEELRQDDGDVFFGVIHLARLQARQGGEVQFVASEFIRDLGWNRDGHTYKRLHDIFRRLASTLLIVKGRNVSTDEIRETGFHMLQYDHVREDNSSDGGKWRIRIPSSTVNLFWVHSYTRLQWELRRTLRSLLARKLHTLYATYNQPMTFRVEQLHALCGSSQKRMSTFKQSLVGAHDELVNAGILENWEWVDRKHTRLRALIFPISEQHAWANEQLELLKGAAE